MKNGIIPHSISLWMDRIKNKRELLHSDIFEKIIGCCFDVMKEPGSGFLENVYKNALFLAMKQS
jgi:hypothetical protein